MTIIKLKTIKDQNNRFDALLKVKNLTHVIMEFTPKLAENIIVNLNQGNRKDKPERIKLYKNNMKNNNWDVNGESIKFGWDGLLKDGQNRLKACIQAKQSFTSCVHFGLNPKYFVNMDTGANRTVTDTFTIMGVPYAKNVGKVIRLMKAWSDGYTSTRGDNIENPNEELKHLYENKIDVTLLENSIKKSLPLKKYFPDAHLSSLYYIACKQGHQRIADKFLIDIVGWSTLGARSPVKKVITTISEMKLEKITLSSHHYTILLTRCWSRYLSKSVLTNKDINVKTNDKILLSITNGL